MDILGSPKVILGHKWSKKFTPIEIYLGHFGSFWVKKGHPFVLNLPPIDFEVASYLTLNQLCNLKVKNWGGGINRVKYLFMNVKCPEMEL